MNDSEIDAIWAIIESNYNKYLKDKGVKLPALKSNGKYTRGDSTTDIQSASYKLISLETTHPSFVPDRRTGFTGDWDVIKARYNYCCASCG